MTLLRQVVATGPVQGSIYVGSVLAATPRVTSPEENPSGISEAPHPHAAVHRVLDCLNRFK